MACNGNCSKGCNNNVNGNVKDIKKEVNTTAYINPDLIYSFDLGTYTGYTVHDRNKGTYKSGILYNRKDKEEDWKDLASNFQQNLINLVKEDIEAGNGLPSHILYENVQFGVTRMATQLWAIWLGILFTTYPYIYGEFGGSGSSTENGTGMDKNVSTNTSTYKPVYVPYSVSTIKSKLSLKKGAKPVEWFLNYYCKYSGNNVNDIINDNNVINNKNNINSKYELRFDFTKQTDDNKKRLADIADSASMVYLFCRYGIPK